MSNKKQNPENEKELIWIDSKMIGKEQVNVLKNTIKLNEFICAVENILGPLSNEQKILAKDKRMPWVKSEVKKLYQFPKADEKFNLESLGIDLRALDKWLHGSWSYIEFELDDGKFVPVEDQPFEQQYYYYVETDNQKEVLRIANELSKLYEDAQEVGLIKGGFLGGLINCFDNIVIAEGDVRFNGAKINANLELIAKNVK